MFSYFIFFLFYFILPSLLLTNVQVPVDVVALGVDMLTIVGHKVGINFHTHINTQHMSIFIPLSYIHIL